MIAPRFLFWGYYLSRDLTTHQQQFKFRKTVVSMLHRSASPALKMTAPDTV